MKRFTRNLLKVFMYLFATAAVAGFAVGGVGGMFAVGRALAIPIVIGGMIIYGLILLVRHAEKAETEENQTLNLAKAMRDAKAATASPNADSGPIVP